MNYFSTADEPGRTQLDPLILYTAFISYFLLDLLVISVDLRSLDIPIN